MEQQPLVIELRLLENFLFEVDFGEFGIIITEEARPVGGGDGPEPSMMLAASVANCLAASLLFALRKHKSDPQGLRATVSIVTERVEKYLRITSLQVKLHLESEQEQLPGLDKALEQFENFCVVTQSVKQGIPTSVEVFDAGGNQLTN